MADDRLICVDCESVRALKGIRKYDVLLARRQWLEKERSNDKRELNRLASRRAKVKGRNTKRNFYCLWKMSIYEMLIRIIVLWDGSVETWIGETGYRGHVSAKIIGNHRFKYGSDFSSAREDGT